MASFKGEPPPKENMVIDILEVQDERTRVVTERGGELEDVILDSNAPDRVTWVGSDMLKEFKRQIPDFLIKNWDVFSWTHKDMSGIDP